MKQNHIISAAALLTLCAGMAVGQTDRTNPRQPSNPAQQNPNQGQPNTQDRNRPGAIDRNQPGMTDRPDRPDGNSDWKTGRNDRDMNRDRMMQGGDSMSQGQRTLVPMSWVLGKDVRGSSNDKVADVHDILMTPEGRVRYVLLGAGGVLGIGEKVIAVPLDSLRWNSSDRVLTVPMTRDQIMNAPSFEKSQWNMIGERDWAQRVRTYFNSDETAGDNDRMNDDQRTAWMRHEAMVRNGDPVTIRGTVNEISEDEPFDDLGDFVTLAITDDQGRQHLASVGPDWFVNRQMRMVREGEQVTINGVNIPGDDQQLLVVRSVTSPSGTFRLRDNQGRAAWLLGLDQDNQDGNADNRMGDNRDRDNRNNDAIRGGGQDRVNQPITNRDNVAVGNATGQRLVSANTLKGKRVNDERGEKLADIDTIVFDSRNGRAAYAVLSVGGFAGIGETKRAVPMRSLTIADDGTLTTRGGLTRESLRTAPEVNTNDWAVLQDHGFSERVRSGFGYGGAAAGGNRIGDRDINNPNRCNIDRPDARTGDRDADHNRDMDRNRNNDWATMGDDPFMAHWGAGRDTSVTGRIASVSEDAKHGNMLKVELKSDQGANQTIYIAPRSHLDKDQMTLREGEQITIRGRSVSMEGKNVIVATDIHANNRNLNLRNNQGRPVWNDRK